MLNGDGNENGKKSIVLISEKTTFHVQDIFFYISLPLFVKLLASSAGFTVR